MGVCGVTGVDGCHTPFFGCVFGSTFLYVGITAILARESVRDMLRRRLYGAFLAWGAAVEADSVAAKGSELRKEGVCTAVGVRGGKGDKGDRVDARWKEAREDAEYCDDDALAVVGRLKLLDAVEGDEVLFRFKDSVEGDEVLILRSLRSWEKVCFAVEGRLEASREDGTLDVLGKLVDIESREGLWASRAVTAAGRFAREADRTVLSRTGEATLGRLTILGRPAET